MDKTRIYHFWNGKNIDGKAVDSSLVLSRELQPDTDNGLRCEIGGDTFSADDLQQGMEYE